MGSSPIDRTKKMTCTFIVQVFFFCKGVRDLNGTLRKQHSALFLVPGVIATALAAQKKAYETPAPVGLRSKSHRPHQKNDLYIHCASLFFLQGSKGLERDVKKTAQCAVFSPRRDSNRVSGAKKGVRNACARRVAEQVPSTAPTEKTILLSSFFHFLPKMMRRCCLFQKTHFKPTEPL